jgi:molybdate transport system permease protein
MDNINFFPLFFSLRVALTATCIGFVCGLPLAYALSRKPGKISDFVDTLPTFPLSCRRPCLAITCWSFWDAIPG